jgi:hypothetical protein
MIALNMRPNIFPLPPLCHPLLASHSDLPLSFGSHHNRNRQRHAQSVACHSIANSAIQSLNLLNASFGSSSIPLSPQSPVSIKNCFSLARNSTVPSATQSRLLAHIYACAARFVRRRDSSESECDDFNFSSISLSQHLRTSDLFSYSNKQTTPVVPILSDRISLPVNAGAVELTNLLPTELASQYASHSAALFRSPADLASSPPAPVPRLCASQSEWIKLVRRLKSSKMVSFTAKPKSVCGVFAVPKDKDADRLIIDARPTNRLFVEPAKVKLPTPDLLAQLETDPSRKFFVAKVDLDNFYHRLLLPVWIREYFALPPVRAADVGLESLYGSDTLIFPCCMTLPMGWSHSVLLAQMAHENFVSTHTALRPCDRITSSTDGLVDRIRHQIYIDDLILIGTDEHALRSAQTEYVDAVQAVGLVVKPSKVVAPSELGVECLGLEVDGTNHTVGVSATKLERLRSDTRRMLESGSCSGDDLSHIVGRWTWAALACRSAFSVFSAVYRSSNALDPECFGSGRRCRVNCGL